MIKFAFLKDHSSYSMKKYLFNQNNPGGREKLELEW